MLDREVGAHPVPDFKVLNVARDSDNLACGVRAGDDALVCTEWVGAVGDDYVAVLAMRKEVSKPRDVSEESEISTCRETAWILTRTSPSLRGFTGASTSSRAAGPVN